MQASAPTFKELGGHHSKNQENQHLFLEPSENKFAAQKPVLTSGKIGKSSVTVRFAYLDSTDGIN